jgi:hypothetical protein
VDTTTLAQIHRAINVIISDICLRGQEDDLLRRGAFPVSIHRACPAVPACHATCTTVLAGPKQAPVRKRIREIAKTWMCYRDRRMHVLLRRDGWRANIKRVRRLVRAAERLGANLLLH